MRSIKLVSLLPLVAIGCACAQNPPDPEAAKITHYPDGTVACKTEAAMVELMHASPPQLPTNEKVLDKLIKSGDCLIVPENWEISLQKDPPLNQQADHASKWTIRTPHGIVHMWGTPMGGD